MPGLSSQAAFSAQLVLPEQRQLYRYWLSLARGRPMPARRQINPADIPRLLPQISLIERVGAGDYRVRLAGTGLREIFDREITGLRLCDFDWGGYRDYWQRTYDRIMQTGEPEQGVVRGPRLHKAHLAQFWLRLPLSRCSQAPELILCHDICVPALDMPDSAPADGSFAHAAGQGG